MIALANHADGVILPVRAQPGARKSGIMGVHGNALKVAVAAPPQDGRANQALIEMLSENLGLRRSQITLVAGASSRDKKFLIAGVKRQELENRVLAIVGS